MTDRELVLQQDELTIKFQLWWKVVSETVLCVTPKEPTIVLYETDDDGW